MEYSVENLEKVVTLFYKSEALQQAEAHHWLTEAQNSPQAWSFVWELLNPKRSSEVQFFAATTLHTKLLKYWNEVPEDHYELLKKRILEAIITYAMGPKLVLNRLCITLSAYVIHTIPNHWPNAFEELVTSFQPYNLPNVEPERVVWILLEILSVIPEEFQSTILAANQRSRVRTVLQDVTKDILKVVEMCLGPLNSVGYNATNLTTYLNSAKCASAWIQLGGLSIDECSHIMDLLMDLVCYVYWNRPEMDLLSCDELEVIEVVLDALSSIMVQPQTLKYTKHILRHTSNILSKFGKILEKENQSSDVNKDIMSSVYGLIITVADTHAKLLISQLKSTNVEEHQLPINVLNCILSCSELPGMYPVDEMSSNLTFGFWYTLQDDILSLDTAECAQLLLVVKPYYRRLTCILLDKSMYPPAWEDSSNCKWTHDDRELFRCYRQDVADTFMYCYNVLNIEMLDILQNRLNEALNKCSSKPSECWNTVESCLHAFSAVAESIEWENLYLPKLMLTLRHIPYRELHIKVLATALDTIGAYSEWLTEHPDSITSIIPLLISGLSNTEVAPNATMALKDVAYNCQKYLAPYAEHLLMACQTTLQAEQLKLGERIRLMYCLGIILSILPVNRIMECLNVILGSSVEDMQTLVNSAESPNTTTSLITRLKMLSALCSTLHVKSSVNEPPVQQPVLLVIQNTLPLYIQIVKKYYAHVEIVQVLCQLLKHTVTTLMDECKPIVPDILQILMNIYIQVPHTGVLTVAKTILIMFAKDENLSGILYQFLFEIVRHTLELCAQLNDTTQLQEKSDVIEGFFTLLAQLSKKSSQLVFVTGLNCTALFECAVFCLVLPEIATIKSCTSFLVNFITLSRENDQAEVVIKCGENLVNRILMNLGGSAPRSAADIFSEILLVLNKKYCTNLSRWLNTLLMQENYPSPYITREQKENFIKFVLKEKAHKRKLSECVTEFSLICRGIIKPDRNC